MTEPLTGYEANSVAEIGAILDDSPADADEVYLRTIGHSERAIAAVAAKRAGGGGGGSTPSGAGSPVGVVTPSGIGGLYIDTTNGSLYIAFGATNADWLVVGGVAANIGDVSGVSKQGQSAFVLGGSADTPLGTGDPFGSNGVVLSDAYAQWNGNGAGCTWRGNGTDGQQELAVVTDAGRTLLHDVDGNLSPAGTVVDLPDPTNPQDAATKAYVDRALGLSYVVAANPSALGQGNVTATLTSDIVRWARSGDLVHVRVYVQTSSVGESGATWLFNLPSDVPAPQLSGDFPAVIGSGRAAGAGGGVTYPVVCNVVANGIAFLRPAGDGLTSLGVEGAPDRMGATSDLDLSLLYEAA